MNHSNDLREMIFIEFENFFLYGHAVECRSGGMAGGGPIFTLCGCYTQGKLLMIKTVEE